MSGKDQGVNDILAKRSVRSEKSARDLWDRMEIIWAVMLKEQKTCTNNDGSEYGPLDWFSGKALKDMLTYWQSIEAFFSLLKKNREMLLTNG